MTNNAPEVTHTYAGVFLVTESGQIIGQQRDDKPGIDNPGKVATFGGGVEPGESPLEAAWRELTLEETNLTATPDKLIYLHSDTSWRSLTGQMARRVFYYLQITNAELQQLEVYEGVGWAEIKGVNDPNLVNSWRPAIAKLVDICMAEHNQAAS